MLSCFFWNSGRSLSRRPRRAFSWQSLSGVFAAAGKCGSGSALVRRVEESNCADFGKLCWSRRNVFWWSSIRRFAGNCSVTCVRASPSVSARWESCWSALVEAVGINSTSGCVPLSSRTTIDSGLSTETRLASGMS
uniref:(northern house mosquito) hypothetical protein n=1 Tax=Culex pipiens TaxID=7175 RepID=A0A8D8BDX6_CULPI